MKGRVRAAPRIVFFTRRVPELGVHIVECSMCVYDVTDFCETFADKNCMLDDLVKRHALQAHQGVPRLVEAVR